MSGEPPDEVAPSRLRYAANAILWTTIGIVLSIPLVAVVIIIYVVGLDYINGTP